MEQDVVHRETDHDPVKIDRRVPLVWLLGVLGIAAAQAVAMYYGQKDLERKGSELISAQAQIAADMRSMRDNMAVVSTEAVKTTVRMEDLARRVQVLETMRPTVIERSR